MSISAKQPIPWEIEKVRCEWDEKLSPTLFASDSEI